MEFNFRINFIKINSGKITCKKIDFKFNNFINFIKFI